tara:strand:- start:30 stop:434 length:405 start_codon:yes stop_codon:yes gene_type:complete
MNLDLNGSKEKLHRFFLYNLLILVLLSIMFPAPVMSSGEEWIMIPSTREGSQWWDPQSLKITRSNNIIINSRFSQSSIRDADSIYYTMEIDCSKNLYKDKVINGITQIKPRWNSVEKDLLVRTLIKQVCLEESL